MTTSGSTSSEPHDGEPVATSIAALERERLLSYIEWGEVEVPWWYWPVYGAAVAVFVGAYALGPLWGAVGALVVAATMGGLIAVMTSRTGVSTPRFRAMPRSLKRTFAPLAMVGLASVGAFATAWSVSPDPPLPLLGLAIGTSLALTGWAHTGWYRRGARRLARERRLRR